MAGDAPHSYRGRMAYAIKQFYEEGARLLPGPALPDPYESRAKAADIAIAKLKDEEYLKGKR